jgi:RinA family phage transcriptional activator
MLRVPQGGGGRLSKSKYYLPHKIKNYVEWQLEHYHSDKRALTDYKSGFIPNGVASLSLASGVKTGTSDPTAKAAVSLATSAYIATTERSLAAIEAALKRCDNADMTLIDLVYWKRTHTVEGAAIIANISRRQAYDRLNKKLCILALELGLINL